MSLRLFIAVEIDDAVRALAVRAAQSLTDAGLVGRFEAPEKMHLTVAFLGRTLEPDLAAVIRVFREASTGCRPFSVDFGRIGAFPNERRPRVVWIGPTENNVGFTACASTVRAAYVPLGFAFDHDASPHITICRPKFTPSRPLPLLGSSVTLHVAGLTLFQSLPAGQTTRYEALERTTF